MGDYRPASGSATSSNACHMANDNSVTQMKSHHMWSETAWYSDQANYPMIGSSSGQLTYGKIAVWVRSHPEPTALPTPTT